MKLSTLFRAYRIAEAMKRNLHPSLNKYKRKVRQADKLEKAIERRIKPIDDEEEARHKIGRAFRSMRKFNQGNGYGAARLDKLAGYQQKEERPSVQIIGLGLVCFNCLLSLDECRCSCSECGLPQQHGDHTNCIPF